MNVLITKIDRDGNFRSYIATMEIFEIPGGFTLDLALCGERIGYDRDVDKGFRVEYLHEGKFQEYYATGLFIHDRS